MHHSEDRKALAIVTGASSGIGLELAKQFADNNFDLVVVAEDNGIHAVVPQLQALGADCEAMQADLSTVEGNEKLCQLLRAEHRTPEVLVINAGVGVYGDFVRETNLEEHLNLIHLNVLSPVILSKKIGAEMLKLGRGKILFTSSVASLTPGICMSTYNASKAFIESFAQALREELKDSGLSVTTLLPGATDTNFFRRAHMEDTPVAKGKKDDPADVAYDGFKALMEGKDHVIGGSFMNAVSATIDKVLPDAVKAKRGHKKAVSPRMKH